MHTKALKEYFATWQGSAYQPMLTLQTSMASQNQHYQLESMAVLQNWCQQANGKNIFPDEERLIVNYLQETARRGFPDTQKQCILCANEILRMRSFTDECCPGAFHGTIRYGVQQLCEQVKHMKG